ncbi:MAG: GW dipeptide domain-containing protein [Saprospiraceae bacterium]
MRIFITKGWMIVCCVLLMETCSNDPKVIEASGSQTPAAEMEEKGSLFGNPSANIEQNNTASPTGDASVHTVEVLEVLPTSKYSYLRVREADEEFWVAIQKREDVQIGATYVFKGGLLKRQFQSQEYDRVFDKVYLVSDFRSTQSGAQVVAAPTATTEVTPPDKVPSVPGAITIKELVANLNKYNGKKVMVTGKCMKINPMIMGRNWVHIQDGSGDNLDLTITTVEQLSLGAVVTLEGTIATNKDFGAGYRYDYIMEGAVLK